MFQGTNTRKSILLGTVAATLALPTLPTIAVAQDQNATLLNQIIVTARKREENLQEVPLSVSAVTADFLERENIKSLDEVAKYVSGFSFDDEFGRADGRPIIRGQANILGNSGVSFFVDGVYITGSILDLNLQDVERIEVIKGPQSALYGRNTYSGAVSITTKSPTDELEAQVSAEIAEFSQYEVSANVRGPLSDTVGFNISGRYFERGGPFNNQFDGTKVGQQESMSVSGTLYFEPSERLDIRARVAYAERDDDQPRLFLLDSTQNNCFTDVGSFYNGQGRYFCGEIETQPINIDDVRALGQKGFVKDSDLATSISVSYEASDEVTIKYIAGYNDESSNFQQDLGYSPVSYAPTSFFRAPASFIFPGAYFHVLGGEVIDFQSQGKGSGWDFSEELQIDYDGETFDAMIGGYYFKTKNRGVGLNAPPSAFNAILQETFATAVARENAFCANIANPASGPCFANFNFGDSVDDATLVAFRDTSLSQTRNIAVFGRIAAEPTDKLEISAEARYAEDKIESGGGIDATATFDANGAQIDSSSAPEGVREATFTSFNPRFTVAYAASADTNLYATAARGNKQGGFNNSSLIALGFGTFDEENVWSYELGAKNVLMDGQMIFNIAGFYNTINNYQLTQSVVVPDENRTATLIDNVGKVVLKGIEVESNWAPSSVPGLIMNLTYAWTDSNIKRGTDANQGTLNDVADDGLRNCSLGFENPAVASCESGNNALFGSIVGQQLPRQAEHMFSGGFTYSRPFTDQFELVLGATASYESKRFIQVHNLAYVGSAFLVSANIGIQNETFGIRAWAKNLTGEDSAVGAIRFADEADSFKRAFAGTPRVGSQFGVTATVNF